MPATAPVGADIESICSKCGDVWHVVVAKVGDRIVKVLCKQCQGQHRYKPPGGKPAARSSAAAPASSGRPRPRASRAGTPAAPPTATPTVAADMSRPVRPYRVSERFAPGDRISHSTFGTGVVESATRDGKIQVFFSAAIGRKVLAAGKPESQLPPPPVRRSESE